MHCDKFLLSCNIARKPHEKSNHTRRTVCDEFDLAIIDNKIRI